MHCQTELMSILRSYSVNDDWEHIMGEWDVTNAYEQAIHTSARRRRPETQRVFVLKNCLNGHTVQVGNAGLLKELFQKYRKFSIQLMAWDGLLTLSHLSDKELRFFHGDDFTVSITDLLWKERAFPSKEDYQFFRNACKLRHRDNVFSAGEKSRIQELITGHLRPYLKQRAHTCPAPLILLEGDDTLD